METTKDRILNCAIRLFNENGYKNVTVRDIAEGVKISPGNLTYHFKNTVEIIEAVYERMLSESVDYIMPQNLKDKAEISLLHFEEMIMRFYAYQQKYCFFFVDLVEMTRLYPRIAKIYEASALKKIEEGRQLIQYFIQTDRLKPPVEDTNYERLGHAIWMISTFWVAQQSVIQSEVYKLNKVMPTTIVWQLILPHLTEKGKAEYQLLLRQKHEQLTT